MTRFARARGSKSSNERLPEDATSWHTMREQMEEKKREVVESKKRKEFEDKRKENYKNFLEERENDVKPEWAPFEQSSNNNNNNKVSKQLKQKKKRELDDSINETFNLEEVVGKIEEVLQNGGPVSGKKKRMLNVESGDGIDVNSGELDENDEIPLKKKKKDKLKSKNKLENGDKIDVNGDNKHPNSETPLKKKRKDNLKNKNKFEEESIQVGKCDNANSDDDAPEETSAKIQPKILKNKKTKSLKKVPLQIPSVVESGDSEDKSEIKGNEGKNNVRKEKFKNKNEKLQGPKPKKSLEEMSESELKRFERKKAKRMRQLQNKKAKKALEREAKLAAEQQSHNENIKNRKLPKIRDDKEHQRRKPNDMLKTMHINGVDVEIDYVDGFPVKKQDAERLRKLRKEMISKGIPKNEVQTALKLERRKAEKALAREKKNVCFNCRKSGHNLSECPTLNENSQSEMIGTGICFKCGSTEHTHFECKVVRTDSYKYATCFICHEQGHISRQCPDNQKGLYPKGGACKVCGDVTHLKKDCPKFQAQQESQTIKLDVMDGGDVEGIAGEKMYNKRDSNKFNKIVKF